MIAAIPFKLVLNDLISNSLKNELPDSQAGEIRIKAHTQDPEQVALIVSDDGIRRP